MKSISHISILIILIGMVTTIPIRKHFCRNMIAQEAMIHTVDSYACGNETMLKDCCFTDIQFYTDDHLLNITFSNFEIEHLFDYWIVNLNLNLRYDLHYLTNGYRNASIIPLKNEVGLYKYVQSFLI